MRIKTMVGVAALGIASLTAAACSEDKLTEDEAVEGLVDQGMDQEMAECVAASIYGDLGEDEASDLMDNEGDTGPAQDAVAEAALECEGGGEEPADEEMTEEEGSEEEEPIDEEVEE